MKKRERCILLILEFLSPLPLNNKLILSAMNIEKIFLNKNLHHFYLPPREKGEEPLIVDFYPPALNNAITMPLSTLEEFVIYLENPTSRIVYNSVNNRDL
jgi:hypothetical protein